MPASPPTSRKASRGYEQEFEILDAPSKRQSGAVDPQTTTIVRRKTLVVWETREVQPLSRSVSSASSASSHSSSEKGRSRSSTDDDSGEDDDDVDDDEGDDDDDDSQDAASSKPSSRRATITKSSPSKPRVSKIYVKDQDEEGPSPSSSSRLSLAMTPKGLPRRTVSSRDIPSLTNNSLLKRTMSSRDMSRHAQEKQQEEQKQVRPPLPPLTIPLTQQQPDTESARVRRTGQYPFQSYVGENPALETKASSAVRERSLSRPWPAGGRAAWSAEPVDRRATAMYPAVSFVGEEQVRIAAESVISTPIVGPTKPNYKSARSASQPPAKLLRTGTAPVSRPAGYEDVKVKGVARAASSAATMSSRAYKRSLSTPPLPRSTTVSYLAEGLVQEEAAKRTMQGPPQGGAQLKRRPSQYPFQSYVGEDPTAETVACERARSRSRGPAAGRRAPTAMYPETSFVAPGRVLDTNDEAANARGRSTQPKPRLMPGADIVESPIAYSRTRDMAPRLSLQPLPSALNLDGKKMFINLDGKGPAEVQKEDDEGEAVVAGGKKKSSLDKDNSTSSRPPLARRRTLADSTLTTRVAEIPKADPIPIPPSSFGADLEKGLPRAPLPLPIANRPTYQPVALRGGEMSWFVNHEGGQRGIKAWRKRTWALLVAIIAIIIIVAVAVPAAQKQALERRNWFNTYPDYKAVSYELSDSYSGTTFFDNFNYFTGYDPTQGHVHYVDRERARHLNLTYATDTTALLRVDATVGPGDEPDASTGRFSVRLESKAQYDRGLFVFDVEHTPFGCGTWPALWLTSLVDWPRLGEIDVMEATNRGDQGNLVSLHTTKGCQMIRRREMTGVARQTDCYNGTNSNEGCNVATPKETYGRDFNSRGGGVVALELRDEGIRMWQFARPDVPRDLVSTSGGSSSNNNGTASTAPRPDTWGPAAADFPSTDCDMGKHFRNQSIIINITLCGQLTEALWGSSGCPGKCIDHVSNNPDAFRDAFWQFNGLKVYKAASS